MTQPKRIGPSIPAASRRARGVGACAVLALALLAGGGSGCAARPATPAEAGGDLRYAAVLVAGDASLPVFDNAAESVAKRLVAGGAVAPDRLRRLSASPAAVTRTGGRPASLPNVLDAVAALRPGPGGGCFVFATSHGEEGRGLFLAATGQVLGPTALDRALAEGCGEAPTVVVVSACFSGGFAAPPM
ncbi:MAG: hypothetical protein JOZ42_05860, partial [Acetobacteraceae bacterium]|nr:hypothetical protein [Acetobacteraceae bacterium]